MSATVKYHGVCVSSITQQPIVYTLKSGATTPETFTFTNLYGQRIWLQSLAVAPIVTAGKLVPNITIEVADVEWTAQQSVAQGRQPITEEPFALALPYSFSASNDSQEIEIPSQGTIVISITNFGSSPAVGDVAIAFVVAYGSE